MNPKLLRKELYDDDYVFNEQEYKGYLTKKLNYKQYIYYKNSEFHLS